jgi:hypothetical protein
VDDQQEKPVRDAEMGSDEPLASDINLSPEFKH